MINELNPRRYTNINIRNIYIYIHTHTHTHTHTHHRSTKYIKHMLTDIKGEADSNNYVGNFITPHLCQCTDHLDRTVRKHWP